MNDLFQPPRNSQMFLDDVYFWTNSVKDWEKLFKPDKYKHLIIKTLQELVNKSFIKVYAYVIMPNHVHFIWEMLKKNKKEMPHVSFNKKVGHEIINDLKVNHPKVLEYFKVDEKDREYRIWQRDPLAIEMDYLQKLEQKLDYIHLNPLQAHWNLAQYPEDYRWSSAKFLVLR